MIRLLIATVLILSSTLVNASQREPFLGISLTGIHAGFAGTQGDLDSGPDQSQISMGNSPSTTDFKVDSTTRYGVRVFRGAYLVEDTEILGVSGHVFSELGLFALPGYKVNGDGINLPARIEMRVDVIGIDANIGFEMGRFYVKGGLHAERGKGRVHYWEVNSGCANNLCEEKYTVTDTSAGGSIGFGYRIGKVSYLMLERQFDYFDKNTLGNSDVTKLGIELRFK
ncbi:MAG: hypothetical protein KZQ84_10735 [Candidatus Thiodiazotropha sp. (ex Lucinoma borealis)]|nr:hypothetical protein [Candidatus Thiodiazotropha sp. (ex Lucinoma borealis)]